MEKHITAKGLGHSHTKSVVLLTINRSYMTVSIYGGEGGFLSDLDVVGCIF